MKRSRAPADILPNSKRAGKILGNWKIYEHSGPKKISGQSIGLRAGKRYSGRGTGF